MTPTSFETDGRAPERVSETLRPVHVSQLLRFARTTTGTTVDQAGSIQPITARIRVPIRMLAPPGRIAGDELVIARIVVIGIGIISRARTVVGHRIVSRLRAVIGHRVVSRP